MSSIHIRRVALATAFLTSGACRNPQADALIAEQMRDIGDEVNDTRQQTADMRDTIDSLRLVVARQDTLLRQLAGMAGVPVPPR